MVNNKGKIFLYKSYMLSIEKIVNDTFLELSDSKVTCSISSDFVNQFLVFEKAVEKISKNTVLYTNFRPVLNIISEIIRKRQEILKDMRETEKFCYSFKNCPMDIKNYRNAFNKVCNAYRGILKNIGNTCNVNVFFLKFMIKYNGLSFLLIQNALKYRICPQLRLIVQYYILLGKNEIMKMEEILNAINKTSR